MSSEYEPPEVVEIGGVENLTGGSISGEADGTPFRTPDTEISA
jgi:hypothetical protein